MKKRNWLLLLLIGLSAALFFGYRTMAQLNSDNQAPKISFTQESIQVSVLDPKSALLQGVTAADDKDGDVTSSVVVERIRLTDPNGAITVHYAAFDQSGNVSKAERSAQYTDYESPRFSLEEPLLFVQNSNFDILDIIGATDTLDGNIRHRVRATSLDDSSVASLGSHEVEFRVTNSLGETVKLVVPVEVYSAGTYTMDVSLTNYLIYLDSGSSFNAGSYLSSVTRNRETVSLRNGTPENYAVKISGTVDTQTPGVYTVDYKVTHTIVNESSPENSQIDTGYSRLIVVVEG